MKFYTINSLILQYRPSIMTKNYFYILIIFASLFSVCVFSQESKASIGTIDGLNFYPNPVSNGKIYVSSKLGLDKEVIIFDVLGKKVLHAHVTAKELYLGALSPGVYIIKFKEGDVTATRKLIIK